MILAGGCKVRLYLTGTRKEGAGFLKGMKMRKYPVPKALLVVIVVPLLIFLLLLPALAAGFSENAEESSQPSRKGRLLKPKSRQYLPLCHLAVVPLRVCLALEDAPFVSRPVVA